MGQTYFLLDLLSVDIDASIKVGLDEKTFSCRTADRVLILCHARAASTVVTSAGDEMFLETIDSFVNFPLNLHDKMVLNVHRKCLLVLLTVSVLFIHGASSIGEVLWAVNCGGDSHTDIHGIKYQRDHLTTGIPSGELSFDVYHMNM